MLVMLKPGWNGSFGRSIRDKNGKIVGRLEFAPGQPVHLDETSLAAVASDIGHALIQVVLDEKDRPKRPELLAERPAEPAAAPKGRKAAAPKGRKAAAPNTAHDPPVEIVE